MDKNNLEKNAHSTLNVSQPKGKGKNEIKTLIITFVSIINIFFVTIFITFELSTLRNVFFRHFRLQIACFVQPFSEYINGFR
mmetsp:Transcript_19170/g.27409  ORF Transcript_19170/g.27409 Transcript_19170/m.27409 type:complete len:82 (+) Transcript_19170:48-293(+)